MIFRIIAKIFAVKIVFNEIDFIFRSKSILSNQINEIKIAKNYEIRFRREFCRFFIKRFQFIT